MLSCLQILRQFFLESVLTSVLTALHHIKKESRAKINFDRDSIGANEGHITIVGSDSVYDIPLPYLLSVLTSVRIALRSVVLKARSKLSLDRATISANEGHISIVRSDDVLHYTAVFPCVGSNFGVYYIEVCCFKSPVEA